MNRSQAIVVAAAAAEAAYRTLSAGRIGWYWVLGNAKLEDLAHFVEAHPEATSEDLFRFGSDGAMSGLMWSTDESLAVAVETFDATLRKMLSRVERDAACPSPPPE